MDFFTDREFGKRAATTDDIDVGVWNGIVATLDSLIAGNALSKDFPQQCPDGQGISGCDTTLLYDKAKALIPTLITPIKRVEKFINDYSNWETPGQVKETKIDTYATLDLIEFCYAHIYDPVNVGNLHEYFNHYHLNFKDTGVNKEKFRREINSLFERNGVAYQLSANGQIIRVVTKELEQLVKRNFSTKDATLNQLLNEATKFIMLPKNADRLRGLEKLWDAFERAKTFYSANKKVSATQLINLVSNSNALLETYLTSESATLTEIGNKFQIRHFETDKQEITDLAHVDYLFFRMYSLLDLFIKELEK